METIEQQKYPFSFKFLGLVLVIIRLASVTVGSNTDDSQIISPLTEAGRWQETFSDFLRHYPFLKKCKDDEFNFASRKRDSKDFQPGLRRRGSFIHGSSVDFFQKRSDSEAQHIRPSKKEHERGKPNKVYSKHKRKRPLKRNDFHSRKSIKRVINGDIKLPVSDDVLRADVAMENAPGLVSATNRSPPDGSSFVYAEIADKPCSSSNRNNINCRSLKIIKNSKLFHGDPKLDFTNGVDLAESHSRHSRSTEELLSVQMFANTSFTQKISEHYWTKSVENSTTLPILNLSQHFFPVNVLSSSATRWSQEYETERKEIPFLVNPNLLTGHFIPNLTKILPPSRLSDIVPDPNRHVVPTWRRHEREARGWSASERSRHKSIDKDDENEEEEEELPVHKRTSVQYSSLVGPSFVNTSAFQARTHALAGQTARLNCDIKNLHNYTISWIRARDINLLTSGEVTYSSDNRFVAVNPSKGDRWVLKIHHLKLSDAGKYLCQVSTSPPMSTAVTLLVTEAVAEVHPAREVFLKVGSPVRLVCTIQGCPYPALPAWYKGRELQQDLIIIESAPTFVPVGTSTITPSTPTPITSVTSKTFVNISFDVEEFSPIFTSPISVDQESLDSSTSTTSIPMEEVLVAKVIFERPKATLNLSGNYSCTNTCTNPLNLTLHVLIGDEETAAMQHINNATSVRLLERVYIAHITVLYCLFALTFNFSTYR